MVSPDPHAHHEKLEAAYVSETERHTAFLQTGQDELAPLDEGSQISNESVNHIFHALQPPLEGKRNVTESVKHSSTALFHIDD